MKVSELRQLEPDARIMMWNNTSRWIVKVVYNSQHFVRFVDKFGSETCMSYGTDTMRVALRKMAVMS